MFISGRGMLFGGDRTTSSHVGNLSQNAYTNQSAVRDSNCGIVYIIKTINCCPNQFLDTLCRLTVVFRVTANCQFLSTICGRLLDQVTAIQSAKLVHHFSSSVAHSLLLHHSAVISMHKKYCNFLAMLFIERWLMFCSYFA